ncbi:hypothetical protein AALB53_18090 [Lachnospiraceae bacterium 47-T17]
MAKKRLESLGYNTKVMSEVWEDGGLLYYRVGDQDDVTGYIAEVDPETGKHRTRGNGKGCFWTEWH